MLLQPLHRARRQRDHAMRRLPAQRLLPGPGDDIEPVPRQVHRERRRRRVADHQPAPGRADPVGARHAHAPTSCRSRRTPGRAPGPGHADPAGGHRGATGRGHPAASDAWSRPSPIARKSSRTPARPRRAGRAATTSPSRPPPCRKRGRCRPATIPAHPARRGAVDHLRQPRLRLRRAMAAAQQRPVQPGQGPAGTLGAGAGGKTRIERSGGRAGRHGCGVHQAWNDGGAGELSRNETPETPARVSGQDSVVQRAMPRAEAGAAAIAACT